MLEGLGAHHPLVVEPWLNEPELTSAGFAERADVLMVAGWLSGLNSPNADGLLWFVREVLPLVRARLPWVRVRVTGGSPPERIAATEGRGVSFEGHVSNMADLYGRVRACIVPLRYGSGVKMKTLEALQYGVPTVSTTVGAEGIDFRNTSPLLVLDDSKGFALALTSLLTDRAAWERQRAEIERLEARRRSTVSGPSWASALAAVPGRGVSTASQRAHRTAT